MKNKFISISVYFLFIYAILGQDGTTSQLAIKEIMKGDTFIGYLPSGPFWSSNSETIYFNWNPDMAYSDSLYRYDIKKSKIEKLDFNTKYELATPNPVSNRSKTKKVYQKSGDIFLIDVSSNKTIRVTNTLDIEFNPHFTANDTQIAYIKAGNLFTWDILTGSTVQVTNFTDKKEELDEKRSTKEEWLYNDQLGLFHVLRERKAKMDEQKKFAKRSEKFGAYSIFRDGKSITNVHMSPDGNYVTYLTTKEATNIATLIPNYVTESGYTENETVRPKVGNESNVLEMFVFDVVKRKVYPVVLDNLDGLDYVPTYTKEYPDKPFKNENRIGSISGPVWSENGKNAILDIRSNDHKDRWIVLLNLAQGNVIGLDHQHDEAWIGGPGIGGTSGVLGWLPNDKGIWFMSEKTGYAHLYALDITSKKTTPLTSGAYEIYDPFLSKDRKNWYFTANKNHPGDRQFYSMPLQGGPLKQLTQLTGNNEVVLSPDERQMAILYSYSNKPTELYLQPNPINGNTTSTAKQITYSTTKEFQGYPWRDPEIITFKAEDGAEVYARLYQPEMEKKNKAAIVFVHGAGYLQNAHKWWSSYYREYVFHNFLVDNGYTVIDIDYRGSAGYGGIWRTGIYRHMGGKDLSDQVDGAKLLINQYGIDKDKIGIYGGSYGGFITLMALFNAPEIFKAGAALRSVGDWAAYSHGYTSRILNTPATDSLAYRRSSPIYFAEGLKGDLLILHGMIDDNVHFQDMARLSQRLIELGKENWEMALYPLERHGFAEPSSWTDEYSRIFKLFQKSLLSKPSQN